MNGDSFVSWRFLDEPAYKWLIFVGMMLLFLAAWKTVLDLMK